MILQLHVETQWLTQGNFRVNLQATTDKFLEIIYKFLSTTNKFSLVLSLILPLVLPLEL
jgi:hypothetical protein